ncbi:MAG: hypothetical protein LBO67_04435 [Spirochaetaceae bacterium]|nr:hypothetical protein [Spirochaetaceae bacterium]
MTYGYKSHFDIIEMEEKTSPSKYSQSTLIETDKSSHFAIMGPGFFKIVLDDDKTVGYTRNGEFTVILDEETETWKLVTQQGYALADPTILYMRLVKRNKQEQEEIIIDIIEGNGRAEMHEYAHTLGEDEILSLGLHGPKTATQLKIYDVPYEKLRHYRKGIYVLDSTHTDKIMEHPHSTAISNVLETSNVLILDVLTRMYYLTVTDKTIKNNLFKAELLKIGIEKYAQSNDTLALTLITLAKTVQRLKSPAQSEAQAEQSLTALVQVYHQSQYLFIQNLLPFLHSDY